MMFTAVARRLAPGGLALFGTAAFVGGLALRNRIDGDHGSPHPWAELMVGGAMTIVAGSFEFWRRVLVAAEASTTLIVLVGLSAFGIVLGMVGAVYLLGAR